VIFFRFSAMCGGGSGVRNPKRFRLRFDMKTGAWCVVCIGGSPPEDQALPIAADNGKGSLQATTISFVFMALPASSLLTKR
jgi:hypothetical protein